MRVPSMWTTEPGGTAGVHVGSSPGVCFNHVLNEPHRLPARELKQQSI